MLNADLRFFLFPPPHTHTPPHKGQLRAAVVQRDASTRPDTPCGWGRFGGVALAEGGWAQMPRRGSGAGKATFSIKTSRLPAVPKRID